MKKTLLLLTMWLLGVLGFSTQSFACSCMMPADAVTSMQNSDSVFAGKVVNISNKDMINSVEFEVDTIWKGIEPTRITVETAEQSATCGYNFMQDEEYLVYAYNKQDGWLWVSLCSRTSSLKNAQDDVIALNREAAAAWEGAFCGGIAGVQCKQGLSCNLDGDYPDAGGICESEQPVMCTMQYDPVCGVNGTTYGNTCMAGWNPIAYQGECSSEERIDILEKNMSENILLLINQNIEKYEEKIDDLDAEAQYDTHISVIEKITLAKENIIQKYATSGEIKIMEQLLEVLELLKMRIAAML